MKPYRRAAVAGLLAVGSGLLLAACANSGTNKGAESPLNDVSTTVVQSGAPGGRSPATSGRPLAVHGAVGTVGESLAPAAPLVIRNGSVSLRVSARKVLSVFDDVSSAAAAMGGFVASSRSTATNDAGGASLVVRVPSADFAALVTRVDSLGKVEAQSVTGEDVTGQSVDIQASLANLESEETALRSLLSRAGSITSILLVQNQLFGVQGDIEQLTAEESSLVNRATYATLDVSVSPLPVHKPAAKHVVTEGALLHAVKLAGHNTAVAVRAIVVALGWSFPVIVLAAIALVAWRLQRRRTAGRPSAPSPLAE